jgi:serine/threonine-protein kinase RsbW
MDTQSMQTDLVIANKVEELTRVAEFLEELGDKWDLPPALVMQVNLALEETLTNTIFYGYDDQIVHDIAMHFGLSGNRLTIAITDDGHEFDPTSRMDPDVSLPAEERPIGGLGIFLIKKVMDEVDYQRKNNRNHLFLTKYIDK